jgi:hypothetical protein
MMPVQYLTNEQGQRVGVLLDVAVYQHLIQQKTTDPDLLTAMSHAELEALAASQLAPVAQMRVDDLLAQQQTAVLTTAEEDELDELLGQIDQLTILKTRARYTMTTKTIVSNRKW